LKGAPDMIVQRSVAGRHSLIPVACLDRIRKVRTVSSARGRLWGYYYDPVVGANYTLMVPETDEPGHGSIVIGEGISRIRLAYPGDELEFMAFDGSQMILQIREIFPAESELISSDLMLISEDDFRRLFGIPTAYATDLVVQVGNPREISTTALTLSEHLPDTRIILREEILRTCESMFNWRGGMMMSLLVGALLAVLICAWDKASGLSQEERREIGILRAIGWKTADIILMKFWEGLVISLPAFAAGILFAYCHVFFTNSALFEPVLKGWAVLYPVFKLVPFIDPAQVAMLLILTVVPCTVATIIPSWAAAAIDPETLMRA
jgi:lipoprotein-releasing system permease protein